MDSSVDITDIENIDYESDYISKHVQSDSESYLMMKLLQNILSLQNFCWSIGKIL